MGPGGGQPDQAVSRRYLAAVDDAVLFHDAHAESGQIVFARAVHAGHFRRFSTHQRGAGELAAAGDAADNRGRDVHVQMSRGVIVQEEQRLGAANHHIVGAHGDQIDADAVVALGLDGELELGAHAVGAGHEHGSAVAIQRQFKQAAETAEAAKNLRAVGAGDGRLDAFHEGGAGIDVDTGIPVGQAGFGGRGLFGQCGYLCADRSARAHARVGEA